MPDKPPTESVRATFVMNSESRHILKVAAGRYRLTQSEIMNQAPFLFVAIAELSLRRRSADLEEREQSFRSAIEALDSLPAHYGAASPIEEVRHSYDIEKAGIAERLIRGPSTELIERIFGYAKHVSGDPFVGLVKKLLVDAEIPATAKTYGDLFGSDEVYPYNAEIDEFRDEHEQAEWDALVADLLGGPVSHLESGEPQSSAKCKLTLNGETLEASSGGDLLAKMLAWAKRRFPEEFERKVSGIRGSTRPLIASSPQALYPGNAKLADAGYYREIPGTDLYVGTNYSRSDVRRLVGLTMRAVGLTEGLDWHLAQ